MTVEIDRIALMPNEPAVYALLGGRSERSHHVAHVGVADRLRRRIEQHLEQRNSSVTTGVSVVSVNPDLVTEVHWWSDLRFADRAALEAAELIAFDLLDPVLRSRGGINTAARARADDDSFAADMRGLFEGAPSGRLVLPTLQDALDPIAQLERQIAALAQRLEEHQ